MASTSLGTLTLDLAVRLSEFTDGLSRAERETRERTEDMGESVSKFKEQLIEDFSGTAIGDAVGSLNEKLASITEAFGDEGIAGAAKIGAASIIASTVGVVVGLTSMAVQVAETDGQLQVLANRANVTTTQFQVLSAAVSDYGIDNEGLSDILADVQEKLGEFAATGAGGLVDTLELLQNNTKMSAEEVEAFGVSLSNVDGATAIQMVKDKLEDVNAGAQITRFTMESLASGLSDISEVWEYGGSTIADYEEALNSAGVIRTQEAIEQSEILRNQIEDTQRKFEGLSNQLVTHTTPALNSVIGYFAEGTKKGDGFASSVSGVGLVVSGVAKTIIGLSSVVNLAIIGFQGLMDQFYVLGQTGSYFLSANGLGGKLEALRWGNKAFKDAGAAANQRMLDEINRAADAINSTGSTSTGVSGNSEIGYMQKEIDLLKEKLRLSNEELIVSTKLADEREKAKEAEAKAEAKLAGAKDKTSKAISNQMMVYKAFKTAGLSDNQARIITAEVGRENDYQSKYLFGGHSDPKNNKYNLGMISWQKDRGEALHKYLKDLGLIQNGQIVKTQEALNAQAMFALKEMTTNPRFDRTKKEFLSNPDIDYDKGTEVLGNNYIAWRYTDPKYASHHGRRDKHYNKLNLELGNTDIVKNLQAENKAIEDLQKKQLSVAAKWAYEKEKIELDYQKDVAEVKEAYAEGSADYIKYMARVEKEYTDIKNAGMLSLSEKYFSEEQRIHNAHRKAMKVIEETYIEDNSVRQYFVDAQKAAYQEDLANFKFAAGAKARERDKMYQSIANSAKANGINSLSTGFDNIMQREMSDDDYSAWRLTQDHYDAVYSVNNQYAGRQSEINAIDERGNEAFPEIERFELLEIAKQEHLDRMWALEQEYTLKDQTLAEQQTSQKIAMYQSLFSGIAGLTKSFAGEQSTAYRIMFGIEQGFAIAQAAMAIQQSIAKAMTIGYPQNIPIIAETVGQGAQIVSNIKNITMGGIAHGGLDYVPKEATYLLDEGERVLSPRQNKDLANFMANGQKSSASEVNITVNVDAKGNSSMDGDTANSFARNMGKAMEATALKVINTELRQGGTIDKRLRR